MRKILFGLMLLTLCLVAKSQYLVFTPSQDTLVNPVPDSTVISTLHVIFHPQELDTGIILRIILPGNANVTVERKRKDFDSIGRYGWIGIIQNQPGSLVLFSVVSNVVTGRILTQAGKQYRVSYLGSGIHSIDEVNNLFLKKNFFDTAEPALDTSGSVQSCPDLPTYIDLMVVYTAAAEAASIVTGSGTDARLAMESLIYQNVYLTNLSYQNSNINPRLRLVHIEKINYTETGNGATDLANLTVNGDGIIDEVHSLRNQFEADVVLMIVDQLNECGHANIMDRLDIKEAGSAFCVVRRLCITEAFNFPHELGHVMGARHEIALDPTDNSPFHYNHGFVNVDAVPEPPDVSFETIMSQGQNCGGSCQVLLYWSNPNLNDPIHNFPMGTVAHENNTLTLNNTISFVSQYRCATSHVMNVWIADTDDDTGQEPDPNTAGESMCQSPSIWVRNDRDVSSTPNWPFPHQHQHQDPIFGQTNWVYVELRNGGPMANGQLEVYWANASLGLTWPASWTLLKSTAATINASSSKIIEMNWDNIPSAGHFCLIARWVSTADPMTFPETANVETNTRQNNNIAWHNLNVIDLSSSAQAMADMQMTNPSGKPLELSFYDPAIYPKTSFFEAGRVVLIMDKKIYRAWKKGGAKVSQASRIKRRQFSLSNHASFENIRLKQKKVGKLTLVFRKGKETPRDLFSFSAEEYDKFNEQRKYVGGVSYKIYTYERTEDVKY